MDERDNMPLRTVSNIITVWVLNGISWILAFSTGEWLQGFQIAKELLAILSLIIAIGFTLYKFAQAWKGWNPRKTKQKELDNGKTINRLVR